MPTVFAPQLSNSHTISHLMKRLKVNKCVKIICGSCNENRHMLVTGERNKANDNFYVGEKY